MLPFRGRRAGRQRGADRRGIPRERAIRLSLAKARAVAEKHPGAIVIGSDQVCAAGQRVLDKPGDEANTRAQLTALSGHTANFYTGLRGRRH